MKNLKELLFLKGIKGVGKVRIQKRYLPYLMEGTDLHELCETVAREEKNLSDQDLSIALHKAEMLSDQIVHDSSVHVITMFDEDYPSRLHVMGDKKPLILYVKGNADALKADAIAFVGTRNPSTWTQLVEKRLVSAVLNHHDVTVVSGLALGCDGIAHQTTLTTGHKTVAVLPCGVHHVVPASHVDLAEKIIESGGCLVSEYEPDAYATKSWFVERDSLIAAMADATVIMECGVKSGTMHAANAALKFQRPVGCYLPDKPDRGDYSGNLFLIAEKNASALRNQADLDMFLSIFHHEPETTQEQNNPVNKEQEKKQPQSVQLSLFDL